MIYTDGVHLITDGDIEELHGFAKTIGLKRAWFQEKNKRPHYDLTTTKIYRRALFLGAQLVSAKEIIKILGKRHG